MLDGKWEVGYRCLVRKEGERVWWEEDYDGDWCDGRVRNGVDG